MIRATIAVALAIAAVACGASEEDRRRRNRETLEEFLRRLPEIRAQQQAERERELTKMPPRLSKANLDGMVRIAKQPWIRRCDDLAERREAEFELERRLPPSPRCVPGPAAALEEFFIDATEVTVAQYAECVRTGWCTTPAPNAHECTEEAMTWPHRLDRPINCVTAQNALWYCAFRGKRLPTPDEWGRAAHGTDGRAYPWGNEPPSCTRTVGRGAKCRHTSPMPAGSRPTDRSSEGVLDMAGNVAEHVNGRYREERDEHGQVVSWEVKDDYPWDHSLRGASFTTRLVSRSEPLLAFRPWRVGYDFADKAPHVGFRCVVNICPDPMPPGGTLRRALVEPCVRVEAKARP